MTVLQKIVLCTGLTAVLIMTIIPPNIVMESSGDSSAISIQRVVRYQPFYSKTVKQIQYSRLYLQCFIASAVTVLLLVACGRTRKSAAKRARELADIGQQLHLKIKDSEREAHTLQQQIKRLTETNEELRRKIIEHVKAENDFRQQYADLTRENENIQQDIARLKVVEKELQEYQEIINQHFEQQEPQPTTPDEKPADENPTPEKTTETVNAGKISPNRPADSMNPKFAMVRKRMINEIESLNNLISESDL
jgi:HD superfamily phosphohydrolase